MCRASSVALLDTLRVPDSPRRGQRTMMFFDWWDADRMTTARHRAASLLELQRGGKTGALIHAIPACDGGMLPDHAKLQPES